MYVACIALGFLRGDNRSKNIKYSALGEIFTLLPRLFSSSGIGKILKDFGATPRSLLLIRSFDCSGLPLTLLYPI
jgi:hypothetical protein